MDQPKGFIHMGRVGYRSVVRIGKLAIDLDLFLVACLILSGLLVAGCIAWDSAWGGNGAGFVTLMIVFGLTGLFGAVVGIKAAVRSTIKLTREANGQ